MSPRRCGLSLVALGIVVTTGLTGNRSTASPPATLETVAELRHAVDLTWRDGDPALYVARQDGFVDRILEGDSTTVLDISDLTVRDNEQGLLGVTFAPDGGHGYVNYTDTAGDTVVAEYAVGDDGTFDESTGRLVIAIDQPHVNHNGGDLAFGPDEMLYIGMGDGGDYGDPDRTAQDPALLLGKMLRIDPAPSGDLGYTVPEDNPFVGVDGTRPEIWATGLRNPWRFSFDPLTGDLWIADVGEGSAEEINVAPATDGLNAGRGLNFGWSAFEGTGGFHGGLDDAEHTPPIHEYSHDEGRCSISGGVRARGAGAGSLEGMYVYGDWCASRLYALRLDGDGETIELVDAVELDGGEQERLTAVVSGPDGTIYVLGDRAVSRLVPT